MISERIDDANKIRQGLLSSSELSLAVTFEGMMQKYFALSVSSSFEHRIVKAILRYAEFHSDEKRYNFNLIRAKAVKRQYHTYFNWEQKNANSFFSLFGQECRETYINEKKRSEDLRSGEVSFLELGYLRNQLVHGDFVTYPFPLTLDEIKSKYDSANVLVRYIETILK